MLPPINVRVSNSDLVELSVTLDDNNTVPPNNKLTNLRMQAGDFQDITLVPDANNEGSVTWTATTTDNSKTKTFSEKVSNLGTVGVNVFGA